MRNWTVLAIVLSGCASDASAPWGIVEKQRTPRPQRLEVSRQATASLSQELGIVRIPPTTEGYPPLLAFAGLEDLTDTLWVQPVLAPRSRHEFNRWQSRIVSDGVVGEVIASRIPRVYDVDVESASFQTTLGASAERLTYAGLHARAMSEYLGGLGSSLKAYEASSDFRENSAAVFAALASRIDELPTVAGAHGAPPLREAPVAIEHVTFDRVVISAVERGLDRVESSIERAVRFADVAAYEEAVSVLAAYLERDDTQSRARQIWDAYHQGGILRHEPLSPLARNLLTDAAETIGEDLGDDQIEIANRMCLLSRSQTDLRPLVGVVLLLRADHLAGKPDRFPFEHLKDEADDLDWISNWLAQLDNGLESSREATDLINVIAQSYK